MELIRKGLPFARNVALTAATLPLLSGLTFADEKLPPDEVGYEQSLADLRQAVIDKVTSALVESLLLDRGSPSKTSENGGILKDNALDRVSEASVDRLKDDHWSPQELALYCTVAAGDLIKEILVEHEEFADSEKVTQKLVEANKLFSEAASHTDEEQRAKVTAKAEREFEDFTRLLDEKLSSLFNERLPELTKVVEEVLDNLGALSQELVRTGIQQAAPPKPSEDENYANSEDLQDERPVDSRRAGSNRTENVSFSPSSTVRGEEEQSGRESKVSKAESTGSKESLKIQSAHEGVALLVAHFDTAFPRIEGQSTDEFVDRDTWREFSGRILFVEIALEEERRRADEAEENGEAIPFDSQFTRRALKEIARLHGSGDLAEVLQRSVLEQVEEYEIEMGGEILVSPGVVISEDYDPNVMEEELEEVSSPQSQLTLRQYITDQLGGMDKLMEEDTKIRNVRAQLTAHLGSAMLEMVQDLGRRHTDKLEALGSLHGTLRIRLPDGF